MGLFCSFCLIVYHNFREIKGSLHSFLAVGKGWRFSYNGDMKDFTFMSIMTICSAGLGLIGALLGIVNTLSLLFDRRIEIKVHFEFAYLLEKRLVSFPLPTTASRKTITEKLKQGRVLNPSIRIVNKSKYTIFITDVGLSRNRTLKNKMELFPNLVQPHLDAPYKMEPFSSLILTCTDINVLSLPVGVRYVYATTAHGKRFFSKIARLRKTMEIFKHIATEFKDKSSEILKYSN